MIKLIVTDMDGTLLNDKKEMPTEIFDLVLALKKQGVAFCIASGNQYYALRKRFEMIKDEIYYIADNGTYLLNGSEELALSIIPDKDVKELLDNSLNLKEVYPIVSCLKQAYVKSHEEHVIEQVRHYYERYSIINDYNEIDSPVLKIAFLDLISAEENVFPAFAKYSEAFQVSVSAKEWMDIMNKNVNKGSALRELQGLLGVTSEETLVFGDYMNDMEMMKEAKYSYAMANAHPLLKDTCNYECPSNNDNGVVKTIKELFKI